MYKQLITGVALLASQLAVAQSDADRSQLYPNIAGPKLSQASWQQKVDYIINVSLDDSLHVLRANEIMTYHNESPNTLSEIYIHLWPNAYLNDETPFARQQVENGKNDFYSSDKEDRGRLDSLSFKVNGESVKWEFVNGQYEICKIILNKPLNPDNKIEISTPFRVKLPKVFSRLGHEGQMYCITQWYPKPAVYDVNGWNPMPYLDQGEFYSEFGKFDVSITVPENYMVAATGNLQNTDELEKLRKLSETKFIKTECNKEDVPKSAAKTKTLRYVQDNVHDFAWFTDKRFKVERSEVTLKNGHKVTTWLFEVCPKKSGVHFLDTAVLFYSDKVGNYPYDHATAVVTPLKAGAGMEYPTITNVEEAGRQVIVHEVGHNWFYGILGTNERKYPWMDESINNYYESRSNYTPGVAEHVGILQKRSNGNRLSMDNIAGSPFGLLELEYLLSARANTDQKVFLPSEAFTDLNYGTIIYGKSALAFHQLQSYLGDEVFDGMMKSYFEKWKFRHPLPNDFIDHAKTYTGKNLDWFFTGLMNTEYEPDYAITRVKRDGENLRVTLKNKGRVAAPIALQTLNNEKIVHEVKVEPFEKDTTIVLPGSNATHVRLDAREESIDVYRKNNYAKAKGIFKTCSSLEFGLFANLEKPQHKQVFYSPIIGANLYNKTMLGMAFYNSVFPRQKTEYIIAPMYSFGTKDLAGYISLQRRFITQRVFREILVGVDVARFAMHGDNGMIFTDTFGNSSQGVDLDNKMRVYEKVAPRISFLFKKGNPRTDADKKLTLRYVMAYEQKFTKDLFNNFKDHNGFVDVQYAHEQKRMLNPYSFFANYQYATAQSTFQKITLELNLFLDYGEKKRTKGLTVRAFAGAFLQKPADGKDERAVFRAAENNGYYDYMYDQSQFGRGNSESLFTQQIMPNTSGFRTYAQGLGNTDSWLAALNFTSTIPGVLPIRPFVDVMIINAKQNLSSTVGGVTTYSTVYEANLHYLAGVSVWLFKDIFQVNFPIYADNKTTDIWKNTQHAYGQRMTFTLKLNLLNPIKQVREAKLF